MASFEEMEKFICVICQDLLVEPVVLPCKHTACLYCLEKTLDNNKYQCFLCRKSIQSWYRKTRRSHSLVDEELKHKISVEFSDLLARRLNGESLDIVPTVHPKPILSSPGEIKRDFESQFAQLQQEIEKEKEKENKLSEELIKQIEEEEIRLKREEEEKLRQDEAIARELALQLNAASPTEQNDEITQLNSDEALAKELARNDSVSMFSPNSMKKTASHLETALYTPKRLKSDDISFPVRSSGNGNLTRKLAKNLDTGSTWKPKLSPRTNNSKKKAVASYGPMDRFVATKTAR